jgi:hypothetical protein
MSTCDKTRELAIGEETSGLAVGNELLERLPGY